jgi:hypothetical protein
MSNNGKQVARKKRCASSHRYFQRGVSVTQPCIVWRFTRVTGLEPARPTRLTLPVSIFFECPIFRSRSGKGKSGVRDTCLASTQNMVKCVKKRVLDKSNLRITISDRRCINPHAGLLSLFGGDRPSFFNWSHPLQSIVPSFKNPSGEGGQQG